MNRDRGYVHEVFGSFQGEGPHVGERHIFVRLCTCNLSCAYCDTPQSWSRQPLALLEEGPGEPAFTVPNPLSAGDVIKAVAAQEIAPGFNSALCVTGGEPLMQPEFVDELLSGLGGRFRVMLETNGTLPDALSAVIRHIDIISMDIKLPSVSGVGGLWDEHRRFLLGSAGKELIIKAVFSEKTSVDEVGTAARLCAEAAPGAAFILQPLTGADGGLPDEQRVFGLYKEAKKYVKDVRVIPQVHKILKVR